jgi:hypothetical protein
MNVIVLICAASVAFRDCTPVTARAVIQQHVQQIGCASPSTLAMATGPAGADDTEYFRIKCEIGR